MKYSGMPSAMWGFIKSRSEIIEKIPEFEKAALKSAGFSKVKSDHHKSKPWIAVIAKK